ncbi:MAG: NUDIX domain-containing protein [Acidimicrobiia bacterium]|nr:NUDIX domain-containing protein [Acidimicrobiia bacterium]
MEGLLVRRVRVGAYAVAVWDERILLTQLSDIDPAAGRWTLPGGGLEFGEQPEDGLRREVYEETSLTGAITSFLGVDSRRFARRPMDARHELHAIALVYGMNLRGEPKVSEVDGSTSAVGWIPLEEVAALPTVELVEFGLRAAARAHPSA